MMKTPFRRLLAVTAGAALAASLAACGPDDSQQGQGTAPLLSQTGVQSGWSMSDLAGVDPAFLARDAAPLPQAVPMRTSYRGGYDYAPAYDYGPEPYYDDGYYADDAGADDYQWLALAAALGGMLGNAPPDYGFAYDGVEPWAWETGDRYVRYAEPVHGGYRYYYYEPDSYTPYLVSDPYYSYGYRDDRLVAIYDRSGRVIDARRAERQRQAAQDYFARARQMYLAGHRQPRVGVPAALWDNHRDEIARTQRQWTQARQERPAWRQWDTRNEPRLHRDWSGEALVRREAEHSFAGWQKADFKTPAPKLYSPQQRQVQLQKVAAIRRDEQLAGQRRAAQRQAVAAGQQNQQRLASAERARQHVAQGQRQRAQAREAALQRQQAHERQADAQLARTRQQQEHAQQQRARAERTGTQRQAQAHKVQQQAHVAAVKRQRAAREHQLEAQRGQQAHAAQQQKAQQTRAAGRQKAQQARAAHQRHAQEARAAQQQMQAQQARAAQQRQAQQTRSAQQQRQAQQARSAQQQRAQPARVAQQQKAQQARAERQKKQAEARATAAKQRSAGQAQAVQGGNAGHGHGHGRDRG